MCLFFILATTQTDVGVPVELCPPNRHDTSTGSGVGLIILGWTDAETDVLSPVKSGPKTSVRATG
jgi:hypothetical protein